MSTPNRDAAAFFAQADPHLYRRNPFRVADLSVHATARDVRRRTEELRVKARLGADTGADTGGGTGLLPLRRRPAPDAVQDALQRLRDPVHRIEDELFWFWPAHNEAVEGARDEALDALRERRIHDAERLWAEPAPGRAAAVAAHNLAVLKHAQALDGYLDADTAADGPGGRDLWKPALRHWRTVLDTDAFWDLVAARARAANDPRLGPGTADELRERLPAVLLRIAADAAVRTSLGGDTLGGFAITGVIRTSGYDEAAVEAAFRAATAPEMERLRTLARSALDRATESPETACDEAVRILDHSTAPLDALDEILTPAHPLMEGVRDEIAERVQQCTIVYGNETKDWSKSEEILGRAGDIAATVTVKTRIKKNLDTAGDNLLYGTCWFCGDTPADDDATYEKKMYGNVREEFGGYGGYQRQIRWQKLAVPVPRCSGCAAAHRGHGRKVAGVGCGFGAAALALAVALIVAGAPPLLPVGLIFLVIIGFFVVMGTGNIDGLPKNAHATLGAWPPIQERLGAGWLFGEKPPNLN